MIKNILTYLLWLGVLYSNILISVADSPETNLFSTYPGAKLMQSLIVRDEENFLLEGYFPNNPPKDRFPMRGILGDVTHQRYEIKSISSLSVFENYKESLVQSNFTVLFECSNESCGAGHSEQRAFSRAAPFFSVSNNHKKPKYIFAEKKGDPSIFVSIYIGQNSRNGSTWILLSTVKNHPIRLGLISTNLESYAQIEPNPIVKQKKKDRFESADHPMIDRYPGSHITEYSQTDYDEISLPISVPQNKSEEFKLLKTVGDITRITYSINGVSTLKIYRNYISSLSKAGFSSIYFCEQDDCSTKRPTKQALTKFLTGNFTHNHTHHARYHVLEMAQGQQKIYVALFVGDNKGTAWTHQVVVRTEALQQGLVETNPDQVIDDMKQKGRASIYGILFEYDKADIKPESEQALKLIAEVLNRNKNLNIYVVGHTDDTGKASYNLNLSHRRATSVVNSLIANYEIDKSRISAHGAGPYSPSASNRNDLGRQANRRVELVERVSK